MKFKKLLPHSNPNPPNPKNQTPKPFKTKLKENLRVLLSAMLIALFIRMFVIEAYKIPTGSMIPTLIEGDHLLVNKFVFGVRIPILGIKLPAFSTPKPGDIVIFHYPKYSSPGWLIELADLLTFGIFGLTNTFEKPKNFIKRIIAKPGDIFQFQNQSISINGKLIPTTPSILPKLWQKIKSISEPEQNTYSHEYDPSSPYYIKLNPNSIVSKNFNYSLKTQKIGKISHIIQISSNSPPQHSMSIPFLYIPKKGDSLKLVLQKNLNSQPSIQFIVNQKLLKTIPWNQFFPQKLVDQYQFNLNSLIQEDHRLFFYYRFYNREIFHHLPANSTPQFYHDLKKNQVFTHTFQHNYYFMIGDNRNKSLDSRNWGFVKQNLIIGSPILIYWPFNRFPTIPQ